MEILLDDVVAAGCEDAAFGEFDFDGLIDVSDVLDRTNQMIENNFRREAFLTRQIQHAVGALADPFK